MKKKILLVLLMVVLVLMLCMGCVEWLLSASQNFGVSLYYYGNGNTSGTVPVDEKSYNYGESAIVLGKGDLKRTGADFRWWNTKADGSGTIYQPGQEFVIKESIKNELCAIWEK